MVSISHAEALFFYTDGSNDFLKISSKGGDVDVYIGDGGSADVQTQEGKFSLCEVVKYTNRIWRLFLPFFVSLRPCVCACPVLTESWSGAPWGVSAR